MSSDQENDAIAVAIDNVFAELSIADPGEALTKAELARRISSIIEHRHLNQTMAADLLGIDQPKVLALLRGRLTGCSIERLLRFLLALDRDVEIVVKPKPRTRAHARVTVVL
jgi:predicted XRE-type DNA-binding protein